MPTWTPKTVIDWQHESLQSLQSLYLLSKHALDPRDRRAAKVELERRRNAIETKGKMKAS